MSHVTKWESWTEEALERERLRLEQEIRGYPAPIPACDVYFNDLLEQRSRICEQLTARRGKQATC